MLALVGRPPDEPRDRPSAGHLGPHRREPRVVAAAQARRGRPRGRWPGCAAHARLRAPDSARDAVAAGSADLVRGPRGRTRRARRGPRPGTGWSRPSGPGGVGKTRLGHWRSRATSPTGTPTVPGTSTWCRSPTRRWSALAVATAFGFGEQPGRSPTDTLVAKLAATETLLVLDNCEHLLDGVTELVERLLTGCPGVTVLATSRARLQVPFESVFPCPGSRSTRRGATPELFVERAAHGRLVVAVRRATGAGSRRSATRLDGVALAIELAAARVATLGARRPGDRADRPAGPADRRARLEDRHRSVRSALDWSFGLLSDDEQVVLRRASVFAAPFTARRRRAGHRDSRR